VNDDPVTGPVRALCETLELSYVAHLTFTEFVDFVLARLYDLGSFIGRVSTHVRKIASELREPVPQDWAAEAVERPRSTRVT